MAGVIYVLVGTKRNGEDEIFYCGRADDAVTRERQHLRDCADHTSTKQAYEYARQAFNGQFRLEVIATEDDTNTEDFWIRSLLREGHPLQNAAGGNSVVPKKRGASAVSKAYRATNAKAKQLSLEEALKDPAARQRLINANRCIYPQSETE